MVKILFTRRRAPIRSRPPLNHLPNYVSQDTFDWACSICTHATYLSAAVQKLVKGKSYRVAYVGIRPAMEGALKSLWVMGGVKEKKVPYDLRLLVEKVENSFPQLHSMFSIQMARTDSFGNNGYRKVNGWAHADPEIWHMYKQGQEIEYILVPLRNMVACAQSELRRYKPELVSENRWLPTD